MGDSSICVCCFPTLEKTQTLGTSVNLDTRLIIKFLRKLEQIQDYEALPVLCVVFSDFYGLHGVGMAFSFQCFLLSI